MRAPRRFSWVLAVFVVVALAGSAVTVTGLFKVFNGRRGVFLQRVIAVGGDEVECCDLRHRIKLNGKPVDEPYAAGEQTPFYAKVPPGKVFLAGDQRDLADDSRWRVNESGGGAVPLSAVRGVVVATGDLFWVKQIPVTTAFTAAGFRDDRAGFRTRHRPDHRRDRRGSVLHRVRRAARDRRPDRRKTTKSSRSPASALIISRL